MHESPPSSQPGAILHPEDLRLVKASLEGNAVARARVIERLGCVPRYLAAANRKSGRPLNPEDLADLAQDTILLVWQKRTTYEGRATLESWAWSFCRFEFWNRARRLNRQRELFGSDVEAEAAGLSVPAQPLDSMDYNQLGSVLKSLPAPEREVVQLKHFENLMFTEIGERLGISPNTAKGRYYRGIRELKSRLEAHNKEQR